MKTKYWIGIGILGLFILIGILGLFEVPNGEEEINELNLDISINQKLKECRELCIGNDGTPVMEHECRVSCNQIYYYFGEEGLTKHIEDMK